MVAFTVDLEQLKGRRRQPNQLDCGGGRGEFRGVELSLHGSRNAFSFQTRSLDNRFDATS